MRYLCLVWFDSKEIDKLGPEEWKQIQADSAEYDKELERRGHYIHAEALQSVESATTVSKRNGKMLITDGPFAETKEQVAGFILVEAADRDQALRLAADIPLARIGHIEVRPVLDFG